MRLIRKLALSVAGVVAATAIVTIVSPRAVHAVTAALVQVVNTPTNAVSTVHAPAASQLFATYCIADFINSNNARCDFPPPPDGKTFFVETFSVRTNTPAGADPIWVQLQGMSPSDPIVYIPMSQQAPGAPNRDYFTGTVAVRVGYAAPTWPLCQVILSQTTSTEFNRGLSCAIAGYFAPSQ